MSSTLHVVVDSQCRAFAARLQSARQRKGWSQAELARRAGISKLTVGRIERGATSGEFISIVRLLCALGLQRQVEALGR